MINKGQTEGTLCLSAIWPPQPSTHIYSYGMCGLQGDPTGLLMLPILLRPAGFLYWPFDLYGSYSMTVQVKTAGQLEGRAVLEVYEMTLGLFFFPGLLLFFFNGTPAPPGGQSWNTTYKTFWVVLLKICRYITVSQICSLICLPSIVIILAPNSTPTNKDMEELWCMDTNYK